MRSAPFRKRRAVTAATMLGVLALPLSGCGDVSNDADGTSSSTTENWRDKIVDVPLPATTRSQQAEAAMAQANGALQGHEDVWALNHYADDGTVVVNLTEGWEEVVGDEVADLQATAPAPVEVRIVEHSHRQLMENARAFDTDVWEQDFAGATAVSGFVNPELNKLVIGLTDLNEASVESARQVFGDVLFEETLPAVPTVGPDRWKDRWPYSGGAGYAAYGPHGGGPACTTGFATRRPSDGKHLMLTAGHCIGTSAVSNFNEAGSLNGSASGWDNYLGSAAGYTNSLNSDGDSRLIGDLRYGDVTVWRESGGDPSIFWGARRTTTYSTVKSTGWPQVDQNLCLSGANGGTSCGWVVQQTGGTVTYSNGWTMYPVARAFSANGPCVYFGDSGGPWIQGVSGGSRAIGIQSGGTRADQTTGPCTAYLTPVLHAASLFGVSVLVNP